MIDDKDNMYKVLSQEEMYGYDVFNIHDNLDGTYDYEVNYYNGGCSFDEAISLAFRMKSV